MKQIYDEGLMDPEFATNKEWGDRKTRKSVVLEANTPDQVSLRRPNYKDKPELNSTMWRPVPPLKEIPAEVRYPHLQGSYYASTGIAGHGVYVSSKSANPDRAFDVIEALASEEMKNAVTWGFEGEHYKLEGDKKVPIIEKITAGTASGKDAHSFARYFLLIWGFPAGRPVDKEVALNREDADPEYYNAQAEAIDVINKAAIANGVSPAMIPGYVPSEEVMRRTTKGRQFMSTATIEYIIGKISEADFDARVAEYKIKYGFIADEFTKYLLANKDKCESLGIKLTLN